MQEVRDTELLRRYIHQNSDEAFASLVTRHVNMVYSAALRKTGNPATAEEITQAVFIILAKKADKLSRHTLLSGWLYQTARLMAANFLRTEIRRVRREQEAYMQSLPNQTGLEIWPEIMPLLEDAMGRLGEKDRNALVLRFFEGKSFQEIGTAFGASENAAKKRVAYALEKMRAYFSRHGVTLTTAIIAGAISANSVQAAPATLAKTATAVALAKGVTASASTLTIIKGALKVMAWSKAKTAIVIGIGVLFAIGTTTLTVNEIVAHWAQAWQKGFDPSVLDRVPRQAKILPALRSRPKDIKNWGEYHGMLLGLNQPASEIVLAAYNDLNSAGPISRARMIFSVPLPEGTYDFISNVPKNQQEALQQEIEKEFGLVGRREFIETNVLALTVRNPNAAGLKQSAPAGAQFNKSNGILSLSNFSVSTLHILLENNIFGTSRKLSGIPVVDRTGLTGYFDLKWDYTHDTLEKAVRDQLGLELVPGTDRVEFLVVDKAN